MNDPTDFSPRRVFTTPTPLPHTHTPHTSSGGYVLTQDPDGDDYVTVFGNGLYRIRRRDYQRMMPPYMEYWQKAA